MNVSIPTDVREAVRQAARSTAARERAPVDASAWIVRALTEKLAREWDALGLPGPPPEAVLRADPVARAGRWEDEASGPAAVVGQGRER